MRGWLQKLFSRLGIATDGDDSSVSPLKRLFSKEPPRSGILLGRQGELPAATRLHQGEAEASKSGGIMLDGSPLAWREFTWGEHLNGSCQWHSVRWRFYENGQVCFDAQMGNSGKGIDLGHMQGHRIELREKSGLLIGVWACGFFVRHAQPTLGFQADIMDDHATLKMHFADLDEKQTGFWLYR